MLYKQKWTFNSFVAFMWIKYTFIYRIQHSSILRL